MRFKPTNLDIEKDYPKLVRDNIIRMIEEKGGEAKWSTIKTDKEFLRFLLKKLIEESTEACYALTKNNLQEELADVMEIMDEVLKIKRWTLRDIRLLQKEKRHKNGGFKKRVKLIK
jgi:predicted house-cleaning noncanonical NTP pyrophosphatase (MazG superfamily)